MSIKSEKQAEKTLSRRQFVGTTLAAAGAGVLQSSVPSYSQPALRSRSGMRVGLHSITFLGIWYRGRGLTLEEVIQRAKKYGYDGVEIDAKRPHGCPLDSAARFLIVANPSLFTCGN